MSGKCPPDNKPPILTYSLRESEPRSLATEPQVEAGVEAEPAIPKTEITPPSHIHLLLRDCPQRAPQDDKSENSSNPLNYDDDEDENSFSSTKQSNLAGGRFEVMPSKVIEEEKGKRHDKKGNENKDESTVSTKNYQQMYLDQKAAAETAAKEKAATANNSEKKLKEQQESTQRYRARELQNQIMWWRQQQGTGQYDDTIVATNVEQLERELNGIPPVFWT